MTLTDKEYQLFHKLNWSLMYYVNEKNKLIDYTGDFKNFNSIPQEEWNKIRDFVYDNNKIKEFIDVNPFKFSSDDLAILSDWDKMSIRGNFFLIHTGKEGAIFIKGNEAAKIYSVCGLVKPLELMFPNDYLPLMVEANLLPFGNKIIYDGLISHYNVHAGSNMRKSLNEEYKINKARYGIISDLYETSEKNQVDYEELLKTYLKNPEYYRDEIENLISLDEKNHILYAHLISKNFFRKPEKKIKELKLKNKIYYALYFDSIVLASDDKDSLEKQIHDNFDEDKIKFVLIEST